MHEKKFLIGFALGFLLIFSASAFSQPYYADVDISIMENGTVSISGLTNHPQLTDVQNSHAFTSKDKELWVFDLNLDEEFSEFIVNVKFPENSEINYFNTPNILSISENGSITITAIGTNEPLYFKAQYSLNQSAESDNFLLLAGSAFLLILIAGTVIFYLNQKSYNCSPCSELDLSALTDRQRAIVELLQKQGCVSQADLLKALEIPKASLSRNLDSLLRKNLIEKKSKGLVNIICLKKPEKD